MAPEQRREQLLDSALRVTLEQGYSGVSIEAIARHAGVTRPVIYDHFPNLGQLLRALIEREERYALDQLQQVVPPAETLAAQADAARPPEVVKVLAQSTRRFLEMVLSRPETWRIILLSSEGTPALVRQYVEVNRANILRQIEGFIDHAKQCGVLPATLDAELTARSIRSLAEEAGRMALTDESRFAPRRFERFTKTLLSMLSMPSS